MKFTPIEIEDALQEAAARQRERKLRELRSGAALTLTVCAGLLGRHLADGWEAVGLAVVVFLLCTSTAVWAAVESQLRQEGDD